MECYTLPSPSYLIFAEGVPPLLYYSHLPALVAALLVGVYLVRKARSLPSYLLSGILFLFALWVILDLVVWTNINSDMVFFAWSLFGIVSTLIAALCIHFMYVFLFNRNLPIHLGSILYLGTLPILALTSTRFNLSGFNLELCGSSGYEGFGFLTYYTALGYGAMVIIAIMLILAFRSIQHARRTQVLYMFGGIEAFLFLFFTTGFLASYLNEAGLATDYSIEQYGLFGMAFFLLLIGYVIATYDAFHTKILGAQVLVITLWVLLGSLLLVVKSDTSRVIALLTLLLTFVIGMNLIRSVRKEVEARELLAEANKGQERFIHFLSHEVKGFLTVARNGFASIAEGDYGPVPEPLTAMAKNALGRVNNGVTTVESILKSANLKSGNVIYKFASFDICSAIRKRIELAQTLLQERKLSIETDLQEGDYVIVGDSENITDHVLKNLIENAIFYTPAGTIRVMLSRKANSVVFSVKDTGVGISAEDKKRLFTEGGQGANAMKVNAHSTGHGLFIAKNIVDAHSGRIWAESEGEGKGTTFFVELPINPPAQKK